MVSGLLLLNQPVRGKEKKGPVRMVVRGVRGREVLTSDLVIGSELAEPTRASSLDLAKPFWL